MTNEKSSKNVLDMIWDAFASVKMAIVIFALIAMSSIVGTVLEQGAEPQTNLGILAELVGASAAPSAYSVLDAMGFMDMYRSWWFVLFLLMFGANLTICSIDRFPPIWRIYREKQKPLQDDQFKAFPIKKEIAAKGSQEAVQKKVIEALAAIGFKNPEVSQDETGWQAYAQSGAIGRLGVYITHISIVILMIGAAVGVFFGFKGYLNVPEGSKYGMAFERRGIDPSLGQERNLVISAMGRSNGDVARAAASLNVSEENLRSRMKVLGMEPLGFVVGCLDFEVSFYGNSDTPKEYASQLVVEENGQEIIRKWIEVNSPLRHRGYTFYQSSYGMMEDPNDFIYMFKATAAGGMPRENNIKIGDSFDIADGVKVTLLEFSPALRNDASGRVFTYTEMMNNPAVKVQVKDGSKEYTKWILKRFPTTWTLPGDHMLQLVDVWGGQYTGLQVRRDPGVAIVYLGCLGMSLGLIFAFFISHRRIWIKVSGGKGSARVTLAASAHKGKEGFERRIEKAITLLTEGGK